MSPRALFLGTAALLLPACDREPPREPAGPGGVLPWVLEPSSKPASTPELVALGRGIYEKQCAACHGADGTGSGTAAYLLYPKPRDFVKARYRLVSTWEGVPTDEDLYRTISRGMPGSAMPSWAHLPERERWALVHHVKSLAAEPLVPSAPEPGNPRLGIVQVPPEPPAAPDDIARGMEVFVTVCATCHGAGARGDGVEKQTDSEGFPTSPRDLTLGVFKGSPAEEHIYRKIVAGMPGTPMPGFAALQGEHAWLLVRYIRSLSSEDQRGRTEMRKFRIRVARVAALPEHPDDGGWRAAPRVNLHLMPLWWRARRPEELTVQAVHDGKEIALLLGWTDDTHDQTAMRPQEFRDAAAVQFSTTPDPPFFAMGAAGHFVNIWMWKSEPAVHNKLLTFVEDVGKKKKIPVQWRALSRSTGTDTDSFAYSNDGCPSVLISIPLRYMHTTVEMLHRDDIENTIKLMYETLLALTPKTNLSYFGK
jgi:DMSO reductase family type II enzyme heme b subunit